MTVRVNCQNAFLWFCTTWHRSLNLHYEESATAGARCGILLLVLSNALRVWFLEGSLQRGSLQYNVSDPGEKRRVLASACWTEDIIVFSSDATICRVTALSTVAWTWMTWKLRMTWLHSFFFPFVGFEGGGVERIILLSMWRILDRDLLEMSWRKETAFFIRSLYFPSGIQEIRNQDATFFFFFFFVVCALPVPLMN
jgi:hypothetical protein